jgi:hypothetical protein
MHNILLRRRLLELHIVVDSLTNSYAAQRERGEYDATSANEIKITSLTSYDLVDATIARCDSVKEPRWAPALLEVNRAWEDLQRPIESISQLDARIEALDRAALELKSTVETDRPPSVTPCWDGRKLCFGDLLCKEYHRRAPNQRLILSSFQEKGWPPNIANPLPARKGRTKLDETKRLSDAVGGLNERMDHIVFLMDGTGEGISWGPKTEETS